MIPISLSIAGFLSYQQKETLDFTAFDLACISGRNGAGKSSILDAITWALFGRARKHDESIINLQSDTARVSLTFQYEGALYRVTRTNRRGETKTVEFEIKPEGDRSTSGNWKPLTERTLRETDQKIEHTLRLDYETFVNAAFFLQGEADQFTQQNPSARKRILSRILGLEIWETYRQRAVRRRKDLEAERAALEGRIAEIQAELDQEDQRRKDLTKLEEQLDRSVQARQAQEDSLREIQSLRAALKEQSKLVQTMSAQAEKIQDRLEHRAARLGSRRQDRASYQDLLDREEEIQEKSARWKAAREELARWEETADRYREGEKQRQGPLTEIASEKARLEQERASLDQEGQAVRDSLLRLTDLQHNLQEVTRKIEDQEERLRTREGRQKELERARERQAEARAENPRLMQDMKKLEKRIADLEHTEGADCPLCGQPLPPEERRELVSELTARGKEMGDRYRDNRRVLESANQVVKDLRLEITELSLAEPELRRLHQEAERIKLKISQIQEQEQAWQNEGARRLQAVEEQLEEGAYAPEARKQLEQVDSQLKDIGYDAARHDQIRKEVSRGDQVQHELGELEKARAALEPLEREIEALTGEVEAQREELQETKEDLAEHRAALEEAREEAPDPARAEKELLDLKEQENILQRKVGAAEQKVSVLHTQKERLELLQAEKEELLEGVSRLIQLEQAFGKNGVPALLIERALPQIESQANRILERLSGGTMAVQFITQKAYQDPKRQDRRETLEIQIRDRSGVRDYEMFSGGEAFRINFAIRLALSHVLAKRAGARLQTLVIDEGFGSQDEVGRQRLIEAINLIRDDFRKILVITHLDQLKDVFTSELLVEKTPRGSTVTLV
jgi:exonuclease SbcC